MGTGVHLTMAQMESLWPDQPELSSARIIYVEKLTSVQPKTAPKMEQSAAHKKEKKEGLAEKRRDRHKEQQEEAKRAQAALEARQTSLRCCTCDRSFPVFRFWRHHSLVHKQKGRKKNRKTGSTSMLQQNNSTISKATHSLCLVMVTFLCLNSTVMSLSPASDLGRRRFYSWSCRSMQWHVLLWLPLDGQLKSSAADHQCRSQRL